MRRKNTETSLEAVWYEFCHHLYLHLNCGHHIPAQWLWTVSLFFELLWVSTSAQLIRWDNLGIKSPTLFTCIHICHQPPLFFCLNNVIQRLVLTVINLSLCRYRNTFSCHNCNSDNNNKKYRLILQFNNSNSIFSFSFFFGQDEMINFYLTLFLLSHF